MLAGRCRARREAGLSRPKNMGSSPLAASETSRDYGRFHERRRGVALLSGDITRRCYECQATARLLARKAAPHTRTSYGRSGQHDKLISEVVSPLGSKSERERRVYAREGIATKHEPQAVKGLRAESDSSAPG
jgi:hypothetical protein